MQAGRRNTERWIVQFLSRSPKLPEPLMGWLASSDTRGQPRLTFETREQAVAFAEKHGLSYDLREPRSRVIRPKSYAENFRSYP